nr:SpoIIE family protein phosphatase [Marichromatium bheemlicum]
MTFRQAGITLMVVLLLGLVVGALELFLDWRGMRADVERDLRATLTLVEGSASEALYQLHPELGRQLVDGLFASTSVRRAELRDNFGRVLAERVREPAASELALAWSWLFADVTQIHLVLDYGFAGARPEPVGTLEIELSAAVLTQRFLDQAVRDALFGLARALVISALVALLFYLMITRPLVRLAGAIAAVDPARPGGWSPPRLRHHRGDEFGLLRARLGHLFAASQRGLDQRDRAQTELTALTHELEQRVQARTAELERQRDALEQAFGELDRAHRELAKANRMVVESIQYARRIQTAMLPDKGALGDGVREIQVCWEPLHLVGGDWFWLERLDDERYLILIADCTGHGVPGAFITLVLASAMTDILRGHAAADPASILHAIDRVVRARLRQDHPEAESDDGLDAAVVIWEPARAELSFAGAGIPLLCMDPAGQVETVRGARAHLGYRSLPSPGEIPVHRLAVEPGARFYLLTDGISDHMGGQPRRLLGRRRLAQWLERHAELGLAEQLAAVEQLLEDYRGDEPRRDDMTLIGFQPR